MPRFRRENGKNVPRCVFDSLRIRQDIAEIFRETAKTRNMTQTQLLQAMLGTFTQVADFYDGDSNKAVTPFLKELGRLLGNFNDRNDGGFGIL